MADEQRERREAPIAAAVIFAGVAVAVAIAVVAYGAGHYGERTKTVTIQASAPATSAPTTSTSSAATVSPAVAAGAHTFVQFACAQCHGMQGRGGVDPAVPALKTVGRSLTASRWTSHRPFAGARSSTRS